MRDEREILAHSLPAGEEAGFARASPRQPDCPLTAELIDLALGKAAEEVARRVTEHLKQCDACRASFAGFRRARRRARGRSRVKARAKPPAAAPGVAAVRLAADLFASGAPPADVLAQTGLGPDQVLQALCEARDRGWLEQVKGRGIDFPTGAVPRPIEGPKNLLGLLRAAGPRLRNVTVFRIRNPVAGPDRRQEWDERVEHFGREVAPALVSLLTRATTVGVGWGKMVASTIEGLASTLEARPPREAPLHCVATAGGLVGEEGVRPENSSSLLASWLAYAVNRRRTHLNTLHSVEGFIAPYLRTQDEFDVVHQRIACYDNYQAIFGGPGRAGVIHQLDAIITSCGNAHHFSPFWRTELPRMGITPEEVNDLTYGNIGGVLLPRENLNPRQRAVLDDIARRWTGIKLPHFQQIARRTPGVILLALMHNKADVVLKCVQLGLVTELLIDEDLALALWDRLDPDRTTDRDLTPLLWRQDDLPASQRTAPAQTGVPPAPAPR
jgi:DNA-binding transcriptional regulator LsrR (DeoR family)